MSTYNVENFGYKYAHDCYLEYIAGNTSAADNMYEKGKEVAESPAWLSYVTKWQTEDVTVYEMDEEGLNNNGAKDNTGFEGGTTGAVIGAAAGIGLAAGATATTATTTTTSVSMIGSITEAGIEMVQEEVETTVTEASTGALASAIIYCVVGALFLAMTSVFYVMAKNGRKDQENYLNTANEIMKYDFDGKMDEIKAINDETAKYTAAATELSKTANIQVTAANTAAEAMAVSNETASLTAASSGDLEMSKIIPELEEFDGAIMEQLPTLESLSQELQARKDTLTRIKEELPKFEKNRKEQLTMMSILTGAGALGAIGGAIGLGLAWTNYVAAPVAMAFFIIGIAAFAVSAILAATEISPQSKAQKQIADEATPNTEAALTKANTALNLTHRTYAHSLVNEEAVNQMSQEAQNEDANVNVTPANNKAEISANDFSSLMATPAGGI